MFNGKPTTLTIGLSFTKLPDSSKIMISEMCASNKVSELRCFSSRCEGIVVYMNGGCRTVIFTAQQILLKLKGSTSVVIIPDCMCSRLIGKGGSSLQKIEEETKLINNEWTSARISIEKSDEMLANQKNFKIEGRKVTLTGDIQARCVNLYRIQKLLSTYTAYPKLWRDLNGILNEVNVPYAGKILTRKYYQQVLVLRNVKKCTLDNMVRLLLPHISFVMRLDIFIRGCTVIFSGLENNVANGVYILGAMLNNVDKHFP